MEEELKAQSATREMRIEVAGNDENEEEAKEIWGLRERSATLPDSAPTLTKERPAIVGDEGWGSSMQEAN